MLKIIQNSDSRGPFMLKYEISANSAIPKGFYAKFQFREKFAQFSDLQRGFLKNSGPARKFKGLFAIFGTARPFLQNSGLNSNN